MVILIISAIIPLLVAWWVSSDAAKRGYSKSAIIGWFLGVWLLLIVFLPLYFILRSKTPKSPHADKEEKITKVCPYCGKLYQGKPHFCPYCGQELKDGNS